MRHLRWLPLLLLVALAASATTIIPETVEQLTAQSTHVVMGRAVRTWSEWNTEHTLILTYTEFQVSQTLKGQAPQTVTVKQLGGSAGGYRQKVAGVKSFTVGDEAVLFLRPAMAKDGTHVVTGLMQGRFDVERTTSGKIYVSNGNPEVSALRKSGGVASYTGSKMTLEQLQLRVQRAVQQ